MDKPVTLEDLKMARKVAAKVVMRFGDRYLPILDRLDEEYKKMKNRENAKSRARAILDED
ncbi:hypothetical protein GCM10007094_31680 [Pseudovibrio japonicus]|uniref:Uncharacterized protein n=1 Tax=Pseudovibrio japonicus TaxID=366534 RepID=A0ABQ3ELC9_9HYPH|nr:hypothetical protein [Pseudovibrio japonicus]GHB40060.1 hypothetical protein GCM10007094_31680 [Pseudovibrio japonicus]